MEKIIMHIDVNNAFLSWTAVHLLKQGNPTDIRNECSVIGGDESKRRGVVLAKSIPAKKCGVVSAETLFSARKKCPNLKVYPPNFEIYKKMSNSLFELLKKYTTDIEIVSIDECFLDYGKVKNLYGDELLFAKKIQYEIYNSLGFTVNIGIANNKICAKMASDFEKPNKIHTLYNNEIKDKMWILPINDLYGVGKSSVTKLNKLNINTIYDLAHSTKEVLYPYFKNQSKYLIDIANGIDESAVISEVSDPKGISSTFTLLYDYDDIEEINKELKNIANNLAKELREKNKYTRRVATISKDMYFKSTTHQEKLDNATNNADIIYETSKKIFKNNWDNIPIRLIGIRIDDLTDSTDYQISLFENIKEKEEKEVFDKLVDKLKNKYGDVIKK